MIDMQGLLEELRRTRDNHLTALALVDRLTDRIVMLRHEVDSLRSDPKTSPDKCVGLLRCEEPGAWCEGMSFGWVLDRKREHLTAGPLPKVCEFTFMPPQKCDGAEDSSCGGAV